MSKFDGIQIDGVFYPTHDAMAAAAGVSRTCISKRIKGFLRGTKTEADLLAPARSRPKIITVTLMGKKYNLKDIARISKKSLSAVRLWYTMWQQAEITDEEFLTGKMKNPRILHHSKLPTGRDEEEQEANLAKLKVGSWESKYLN